MWRLTLLSPSVAGITVHLFADIADVGSAAGTAGWVGTGLLGSVLAWLLFVHLPSKDKQVKELIDTRDSLLERQTVRIEKLLIDQGVQIMTDAKIRRDDFKVALDGVINHCQRESTIMREIIEKDMAEHTSAIIDLRRVLEEYRETTAKNKRVS